MYIGNTAERGLHQLVYEAVDNAVDEALAGYATESPCVLGKDGSCSVEDDGRGIPIDMHAEEKMPAVEVVMTMLHAGGKFGRGGYKVSGGLHGVGISVVNALSEQMTTRVQARRQDLRDPLRARHHDAEAEGRRHGPTGPERISGSSPTAVFETTRLPLGHPAEAPARTGVPQPRPRDHAARRARRGAEGAYVSSTTAASSRSSSTSTRRRIRCIRSSRPTASATGSTSSARCSGPIRTASNLLVREQHQHDRGRHAPPRLPHGRRQRDQRVREETRPAQRVRRQPFDRRLHGRPDRGRFGEARGAAVRGSDQDEARQREGAQHRLRARQRAARFLPRRESRSMRARSSRSACRPRARARRRRKRATSRAARTRSTAAAFPANSSIARTPTPRRASCSSSRATRRAAPRRWAATSHPSDPAAAGQDPQRREGAPRQGARRTKRSAR